MSPDAPAPAPADPPKRIGPHVIASLLIAAVVAIVQAYLQGRGFYPGLSVVGYLGWAVITLIVAWGSAAIIAGGRHEAFAFGFVLGTVALLFLLTGFGWRLGFRQEFDKRITQDVHVWAAFVARQTLEMSHDPIPLPADLLPDSVKNIWRRPPTHVEVLKYFVGQETAVIDVRWESGLFVHGLLIGPAGDVRRYDERGSTEVAPEIHFYRWIGQ
ncbi:MAG: hypothetical protein ACI8W8_000647 [Rhodothermales bacterium]|jgi:hypothetical protein